MRVPRLSKATPAPIQHPPVPPIKKKKKGNKARAQRFENDECPGASTRRTNDSRRSSQHTSAPHADGAPRGARARRKEEEIKTKSGNQGRGSPPPDDISHSPRGTPLPAAQSGRPRGTPAPLHDPHAHRCYFFSLFLFEALLAWKSDSSPASAMPFFKIMVSRGDFSSERRRCLWGLHPVGVSRDD